jgi:Holliday junction resolvasome RuvABC endonuclease subunit
MIVLGIDPGTHTGYCLISITGTKKKKADIYEYGHIDVDTSSQYEGDHNLDLMSQLQHLIYLHSVDQICVEDYFFSKRFCNGSNVNAAFRTAIHILARQNDIPYTILNISLWKTYIAGRSTPTKAQKAKWGKEPAKKLYIQQALWDNYRIRFPNHCISKVTNKPIAFRLDIVDVVAQTIYFAKVILKVDDITISVKCPADIVYKKPPKKMFIYDSLR